MAELAAARPRRSSAAGSCWPTSGRTPASTGCARCPTSAPGTRSTATRGWSCSASTRRSSRSRQHRQRPPGRGDMDVRYPVAIDSDYAVWRAFGNHYWPAAYLADAEGRSATTSSARAATTSANAVIQQLLREAGADLRRETRRGRPSARGAADWTNLRSPETYVGYAQGRNFASPGGAGVGAPAATTCPMLMLEPVGALRRLDHRERRGRPQRGRRADRVPLPRPRRQPRHGPARARDAVPFRVLVDGQPPATPTASTSTNRATELVGTRLYQLIRQPGPVAERTSRSSSPAPACRRTCSLRLRGSGLVRRSSEEVGQQLVDAFSLVVMHPVRRVRPGAPRGRGWGRRRARARRARSRGSGRAVPR